MLNEFYDFIAKKINSFFQTAAADGTLLKGESFCLKLDNEEMVTEVANALEELATSKDSTFSREKISIVAAIKFMLAFLKHKDIVWVPVSLEEMLRVSGGAGLSKDEGVLSAKNLGFEKGPTSDDLLFIGLDKSGDTPKIYLYPTEVKTGNNEVAVIKKAFEQASATAEGLHKAFNPGGEIMDTILYKVNRNFLMQMLVTSCKKMQVYHVDDSQNWDEVLDTYREAILNERYFMSENIQELLGKGAVLSFRKGLMSRRTSFKEDAINFIEMPERDEFGLILKQVAEIYEDIHSKRDSDFLLFDECIVDNLTGDLSKLSVSALDEKTTLNDTEQDVDNTDISSGTSNDGKEMPGTTPDPELNSNPEPDPKSEPEDEEDGMNILFGLNEQNGQSVIWRPNDTTQLFHTNTGIIGTMGTGKTQFTKSLITQLYREQIHNVDGEGLGILIFDYKGDYNESKTDFVNATNATILKPYHLPFNPLALVKSSVFKPLLPTHTANAFKDIAAVNSSQEQLLEIAGGELPLLLVSDLLKDIGTQGKAEQEKKLNKVALEKVNVLYERFAGKSEDVAKFISFMMTEINSDKSEELYNLSDYNLYQIELLNADKLKRCALHTQELVAKP